MANEMDDNFEESASMADPVSQDRAQRFYDRVRDSIRNYLETKGGKLEKFGDYLLLVPDTFMLLWRLVNDPRVNSKNKMLLGSGLAYYFFPFDIIPEGFVGPIGYLDDLVFAVYMLNRMIGDTDVEVLREHWSGDEDVLHMIRKVLDAADNLVGGDLLSKLKNMGK
ncbi:MAG TPA: DUF1232 domain-containing protein [Thermoanaerobaculia bacterium]